MIGDMAGPMAELSSQQGGHVSRRAIPRHEAVERHLRSRIAGLHPGDPLESEAELCDLFQVSRMTVRQAMNRLVSEGAIYRISGVGTFVGQPEVHREMGKLRSFTDEMAARGLRASSRVLSRDVRPGSGEELAALQLAPGANVIEIRRLRSADDEPMAIESTVLTPALTWVLETNLETSSLYSMLESRGVHPARATGTQVAAPATEEDAALLDLVPGAPLLVERRLVMAADGSPIERTETRYAGSRFVFHIELVS